MTEVKCPSCGTSINVPEKKTGLYWGIGCLVAAVTIPFVVAVIGLLAAIAIPSFIRARDTSQLNACLNNMRIIDAAKNQCALARTYKAGETVSEQDVSPYLKNGFSSLLCPKNGRYTTNPIGKDPECSVHGPLSSALDKRTRSPNIQASDAIAPKDGTQPQ